MSYRESAELRQSTRVSIDAPAFVSFGGKIYSGRATDISTRSIRVTLNADLPVGAPTEVIITYQNAKATMFGTVEKRVDGGYVIFDAKGSSASLRSLFFSRLG